jgi:hypothetical protein
MIFLALGAAMLTSGSNAEVADGKPFPICFKDDHRYTTKEIIDFAIKRSIRMAESAACRRNYISVADFRARNPGCCEIDLHHRMFNEPIETRHLAGIGDLLGVVKMRFYCDGSDKSKSTGTYMTGYANITSCGIITESTLADPEVGHPGSKRD